MRVSEPHEEYAGNDPIMKAFGSLANSTSSRDVVISGHVAVVPSESFAESLASKAGHTSSDLILVPWSETGTLSELPSYFVGSAQRDALANKEFARLTEDLFRASRQTAGVAVYIDRTVIKTSTSSSSSPNSSSAASTYDDNAVTYSSDGSKTHLHVLYASTADDLYAVKIALQLAQNSSVILSITKLAPVERLAADTIHQNQTAFDDLRTHGSTLAANKVTYTTLDVTSVTESMFVDGSQNTVFIVGRSVADHGDLTRVSTGSANRALGTKATEVIARIKASPANAGVLVVQARDEGPAGAGVATKTVD